MNVDKSHVALIRAWSFDQERFIREALNVERISNQQAAACKEVDRLISAKVKKASGAALTEEEREYAGKTGISIMSGQGTGKDAWTAWLIIKILCCFPYPKIPCTAPTGHQLKDVLWAEINKWLRQSNVKDWLVWQTEQIYWKEAGGREWFAVARTVNTKATADEQAETLQGFHEDYLVFVVEEASGVPAPVFRPLEGTLTGKCNFAVLIFNPTHNTGFAVETHRKDRERWIPIHWNAEESDIVEPGAIERMAKKYGRDSNMYRIRVRGLPPTESSDTLIQWEWAMNAVERELMPLDTDQLVFGVDVGGGGDPSVILRRRGPLVEGIEMNETADSEALTGWIMKRMYDYEPAIVFIDPIGLGWGILGNLQARCSGFNVIGVNVSDAAAESDRFYRLRDELFWRLRTEFERGTISIPDDPMLIGELTSIKHDDGQRHQGKIKVESKADMKRRGIDSPNKADSLCITEYYETPLLRRLVSTRKRNWRAEEGSWKTQ